jgi:hypothetical protein
MFDLGFLINRFLLTALLLEIIRMSLLFTEEAKAEAIKRGLMKSVIR